MAAAEWTTDDVLRWLAEQGRPISASTWYAYVSRGQAPAPKRHVGRTPVWDPRAVKRFHEAANAKRVQAKQDQPTQDQQSA
jgi:hypothetical protein